MQTVHGPQLHSGERYVLCKPYMFSNVTQGAICAVQTLHGASTSEVALGLAS